MKTIQNGYSTTCVPAQAEIYLYRTDNLLRVENDSGRVKVRAMRDNLAAEEKSAFVRQLALEGFIPDEFQGFSEIKSTGDGRVRWEIDDSWTLRLQPVRLISRFGRPCIATSGMLLLLALMAFFGFRVIESTTAAYSPHSTQARSMPASHRAQELQDQTASLQ